MVPKWRFRIRITLFATLAPPISTPILVTPPFLFYIFKGDLTMKADTRFDEILIVGYFLNGLSILDVKFANLAPPWRHLYGRDGW